MSDRPPADTLPALFVQRAAASGPKPLFLVKRDGAYRPMSWRQAADDVCALAAFLLEQGVAAGDRAAILSENRPEWGIGDLAIQSVGAWTVPLYPSLTAQDIHGICRDCEPVACVASTAEQARKIAEIRAGVPSLRVVIAMDGGAGTVSWADALARGRAALPARREELDARRNALRPGDTATLIYTSGTTGEPKGVMLSHRNFLSNVRASLDAIPICGDDLHLSFLPLCHVFERMAGWYLMLDVAATVAYAESMDTIPDNMREVRPTVMLGVPRFFEKLYARIQEALRQMPPAKQRLARWAIRVGQRAAQAREQRRPVPPGLALQVWLADRLVLEKFRRRLGGRLRFFVSGSAPLSADIGRFFSGLGITIIEGYGLTETSPVIAVNRLSRPKFGTVGPLISGVEVRIADDGEILTRGPHVMQGYYRKPEETAAVITDGWLHTGDVGHLDGDGHLVITDRKKDLIKTAGGKFVAPQKLENLFVTDPYVSQAFVYGDRQRYCVALVVPNMARLREYAASQGIAAAGPAQLVQDARIREFYWQRVQERQGGLASFEQVKAIALLDQEFTQAAGELTPTLKAKRGVIAQRYAEALRRLYEQPA
ncbi:MAG: long-chain fatty acid--CoA ligase [Candidatus Omnitrophica bacterium]|nr:long-chain fatty acid--CoA ligase [Candidatus Omnitrophota bacterium]